MTRPLKRLILLALTLLSAGTCAAAAELTVSAAASLTNAFKALAPGFEAQNPGVRLQFNFGASDALLAQIQHGAPVDVFASADQDTMDRAEQRHALLAGTRRDFAGNQLVLVKPVSGRGVAGLPDLAKPEVKRVVLGKPESVPAGRYARGALEAAGLWAAVEPKAIYATNVRQALDYVARAEVDAGLVYATDAALLPERVGVVTPVATLAPIRYPVAALAQTRHPDEARRFVDYLRTPPAKAVLIRFGFLVD